MNVPSFGQIDRSRGQGVHPYLALLPGALESPAMRRICGSAAQAQALITGARVQVAAGRGFAFIDVNTPCIVLSQWYYRTGSELDLYLDLLHELTHLRQLAEGADLWDERFAYVDRVTEIEGYAVAVEEGRRLGMGDEDVIRHLHNPWMSLADVHRLVGHVDAWLQRPRVDW